MDFSSRRIPRYIAFFLVVGSGIFLYFAGSFSSQNGPILTTNSSSSSERRAYATFLSTRVQNDNETDPYFTATRVLAYQLLHQPSTRTEFNIPFLVLAPPHVSEHKLQTLRDEGATVIRVPNVETPSWLHPGRESYIDQFTKLRLFELTSYDRVLYMDNDMLLTRSLDPIWSEHITQHLATTNVERRHSDEPIAPTTYLIVGVGDLGSATHPNPPPPSTYLNGGFFLLSPSSALFTYYTTILSLPTTQHRIDSSLMEQSLLNYIHHPHGPMPALFFEPGKWACNWPGLQDLRGGCAALHDKFWDPGNRGWIDRRLVEMWWRTQGRSEGFWDGRKVERQGGR